MREGKRSFDSYLLPLLLLLVCGGAAMAASPAPPNGYNCSTDRTVYPCQSYAFYRAGADASLLDLASIGDLFGVSRVSIARASNLTVSSPLRYGEPLLVPLSCSCATDNRSYAAAPYQIAAGDTFYLLSTIKFANLTAYPAVQDANPSLVFNNLDIGVIAIFPVFCQCPAKGSPPLATYVLQPSDTYASLSSSFGTDVTNLTNLNGREADVKPYSTILVPVPQIPPPVLLRRNSTTPAPAPPPPPAATTNTVVERKNSKGLVAGLAVGLAVMAVLWVAAIGWLWRRRREYRGQVKGVEWREKGEKRYGKSGSDDKLMADISEWLDKYRLYGMEELREATSDFDESCLIEGSVYKGVIGDEVYAVKKMKWDARDELKILQKVNHTNLVKLEGFCIDPDAGTCYLVYEYVENGSLHSRLHDTAAPAKLDWRSRLRVALDLANGLQYIHEHTWPRVVHKDIKSSNVLLDAQMHAKIANFGLARSGCNAVTTHIVGTQGYVAPEYLADGLVTTKMDVFAYGVVLLELVTGREAADGATGDVLWVQAEAEGVYDLRDAKLMAWMDEALVAGEQTVQLESVASVLSIAKACLQRDPSKRPSMMDVVYTLSKADELFSDFSEDGATFGSDGVTAR